MKGILFRGKRTDRDKWVQGYIIVAEKDTPYIIPSKSWAHAPRNSHSMYSSNFYRVGPETVGQYTGLTDKNGTKIFEGDIVNRMFYFGLPVLSVVTFINGAFGLEWNRGKVKEFSAFTSICNCTYEVIGNIYDNPELLKGGADDE